MIKNFIFDFGNVLAEFNPEKLTAPFVHDAEMRKYISEVVFDRIYWDKLDSGSITDEAVKAEIRSRISGESGDLACMVYDNWISTLTPVKGMQQLICDIRKTDKKMYLLSNISIGFATSYVKVKWIKELLDCFDGLVLSGTIGKVKPDRDIFEYLLETFDLNADECLFIDDSAKNIEGAKCIGIDGYLFQGNVQLLRNYLGI